MKIYNHYINGAWVEPAGGEYFDTENPYTGEVWAKIARGTAEDADRAVKAAKAAFEMVNGLICAPPSGASFWFGLPKLSNAKRSGWVIRST